jgi:hypothetical protein
MNRNKEHTRSGWVVVFTTLALLAVVGCGGSSPTSPSISTTQQGTVLTGTFTSRAGQVFLQTAYAQNTYVGMTVYVLEAPDIQTTVSSDGSFTLRGLPDGQFTLVFSKDGHTVSTHDFEGVLPNSEITIVLEMTPRGGVRILSQKRTGIGHGGVEFEGLVDSVSPNEAKLAVNGYTVMTQPGVTAIREGNRTRTLEDIRAGNRVHVKGEGQGDHVLAHEIKLQNDGTDGDENDGDTANCPNGGKLNQKIVLEGYVNSGNTKKFTMRANGRTDDITVTFNGEPRCVGQAGKSGNCEVGENDKVNVKGTLKKCSLVEADEVKIQKKGTSE